MLGCLPARLCEYSSIHINYTEVLCRCDQPARPFRQTDRAILQHLSNADRAQRIVPLIPCRQSGPSHMNAKQRRENKAKRPTLFKGVIDLAFFLGWIFMTGLAGYFLGVSSPNTAVISQLPCAQTPVQQQLKHELQLPLQNIPSEADCSSYYLSGQGDASGSSWNDIKNAWRCSKAKFNGSTTHIITDVNLKQTKWKSVLAADPDKFFRKYLTQYPGDMAVTQPVIIFSHSPVKDLDEVSSQCKVLDVAIVPDKPGVCVAVTETFHDVASYHMLHAQRGPDGQLSLTPNYVRGRNLPSETSYEVGRGLLLGYFTHAAAVVGAMKLMTPQGKGKRRLVVGCLIETKEDVELFKNSVKSYKQAGGDPDHLFAVSRFTELHDALRSSGAKNVWILKARNVGSSVTDRGSIVTGFVQTWVAFSAADLGADVIWQAPGTVWLSSPETVVGLATKDIETHWMFRGRNDPRAAPFFISTDFFFVRGGQDRAIHLLHEIMLHADLTAEWRSIDALAAYRLSENNARYGTTSVVYPPTRVLNTALVGHQAAGLTEAVTLAKPHERPLVVVVPRHDGPTPAEAVDLLKAAKLWLLD